MSLASPLWLLLLGLIPVIVVLHALSLRWRSTPVSSLLFWEEALRERSASVRLRRLLGSLVLILQIVAVAVLATALAGPRLSVPGLAGSGGTILVLDATASMQTREGSSTRFDIARARGQDIVTGLRRGSRMAVILAARAPRLAQAFTDDRAALRRALRSAAATDEPGDVADSMAFALSLRDARRGDQVVLVTDGAFESLGNIDASRTWVHVQLVGTARDNAGITGLAFRRATAGTAPYELFLAVRNSGRRALTAPLTISVDGSPVVTCTVSLPPGGRSAISIPWTGPTMGRVEARLETGDALPLDDRAYAVFAAARQLRVRVVGAETYFTQKALSALPGITVRTERAPGSGLASVSPAPGDAGQPGADDDVVVYENVQPPPLGMDDAAGIDDGKTTRSGRQNVILLGAVPPDLPVKDTGRIERPTVTGWSRNDPLLSSVSLAGLTISGARGLEPGPGFRVLAASGEYPLMLAWDHARLKVLMLAFDPQASDLPLRAGFPILIANALSWFFPTWLAVQADQEQAGSTRSLTAQPGTGLTVEKPDGSRISIAASGPSVDFTDTDRTGFYRVETGQSATEFAVNLASDSETDVTPRFVLPTVAAPDASAPSGQSPIWGVLAAISLALVLAEWLAWLRASGKAGA
jgi:Ca-activated chloride channel homolog